MIISDNKRPPLSAFQSLMRATDSILNQDATRREDYYAKRSGKAVEGDVYSAMCHVAQGTPFEGTIQLISGFSFPDIVAHQFYGVEVKSTAKNHWTSIGSSILESTRSADVERIFLTFAKLGKPVQFLSRPYEECLSGIAVTHYPRYQIDMRLKPGETIFDKMGIPYDQLRQMDNPAAPVSQYYKSKLGPGESLWWAADNPEQIAPATVRLWTALSPQEKEWFTVQGYVLFPEVLSSNSNKKYNRYALWLATQQGVVNTNIRDSFSAGGKVIMQTRWGTPVKVPAVFGRIRKYRIHIKHILLDMDASILMEYWNVPHIEEDRIRQWCELVCRLCDSDTGPYKTWDVLSEIFHL